MRTYLTHSSCLVGMVHWPRVTVLLLALSVVVLPSCGSRDNPYRANGTIGNTSGSFEQTYDLRFDQSTLEYRLTIVSRPGVPLPDPSVTQNNETLRFEFSNSNRSGTDQGLRKGGAQGRPRYVPRAVQSSLSVAKRPSRITLVKDGRVSEADIRWD